MIRALNTYYNQYKYLLVNFKNILSSVDTKNNQKMSTILKEIVSTALAPKSPNPLK